MTITPTIFRAAEKGADEVLPEGTERSISVMETDDWQGESSLSIDVIVPDDFFKRNDVGDKLIDLADHIRRQLIAVGEKRFPYVELSPRSAAA